MMKKKKKNMLPLKFGLGKSDILLKLIMFLRIKWYIFYFLKYFVTYGGIMKEYYVYII